MKEIALIVACNVLATAACVCACFIACSGHDGWGWFLFVAMCTAVVPSGDKGKDTE